MVRAAATVMRAVAAILRNTVFPLDFPWCRAGVSLDDFDAMDRLYPGAIPAFAPREPGMGGASRQVKGVKRGMPG
jgi:hypothetical protein